MMSESSEQPVDPVPPASRPRRRIYKEDVVCLLSSPGRPGTAPRFGVITEIANNDSESEDEEDEAKDKKEALQDGHVRVWWGSGNVRETTSKEEQLSVVDRIFLHGDTVASVDDPLGQLGTVVDVKITVDLESADQRCLQTGVSSLHLRPVRSFHQEQCVTHGRWLGRVQYVMDDIIVLFDDGSKCEIESADPNKLFPSKERYQTDNQMPFYPGQRVRASTSAYFHTATWLRGHWKANLMEGTVLQVKARVVGVDWLAAGYHSPPGLAMEDVQPSPYMNPEEIHPLSYWDHSMWQIGDRTLPVTYEESQSGDSAQAAASDHPTSADMAEATSAQDSGASGAPGSQDGAGQDPERWPNILRRFKRKDLKKEKKRMAKAGMEENFVKAWTVTRTYTKVDVVWQDGTRTDDVEGVKLVSAGYLGTSDFFPHEYVMDKPMATDDAESAGGVADSQRVGWIKSVDAKQRTAVVCWRRCWSDPSLPPEVEEEKVESVYELVEHPDYNYRLGDVVVKLATEGGEAEGESRATATEAVGMTPGEGATAEPSQMDTSADGTGAHARHDESARMDGATTAPPAEEASPSWTYGPPADWAGEIIQLNSGRIQIYWGDGSTSWAWPHEIFVVSREEDSTADDDEEGGQYAASHSEDGEHDDENGSQGSWETGGDMDNLDVEEEELLALVQGTGDDDVPEESDRQDVASAAPNPTTASSGVLSHLSDAIAQMTARFTGYTSAAQASSSAELARGQSGGLADILREECEVHAKFGETLRDLERRKAEHAQKRGGGGGGEEGSDDNVRAEGEPETVDDHAGADGEELEKVEGSKHVKDEKQVAGASVVGGDLDDAGGSARVTGGGAKQEPPGGSPGELTSGEEPSAGPSESCEFVGAGFRQFDCVECPAEHHFIAESEQPTNSKKWTRKIQQEWGVLQKSLPDTIAVRVYEDRLDLARAVMVGASGTPYHDGLHFFDFYFPPDYPNSPPMAHYDSRGLRVNPNLYDNGKVCLSLLNTWNGKGTEMWDPNSSSLLQVLVSIQGLVLVPKPYFNEAGYDKQIGTPEGEKNAVVYNESTFLLCCKLMLYQMRRPPQHFEELVRSHYQRRAKKILWACDSYLIGASVGSLPEDIPEGDRLVEGTEACTGSAGFKLMLSKLRQQLATAFDSL